MTAPRPEVSASSEEAAARARRAALTLWGAWGAGDLIDELPAEDRPRDEAEGHLAQAELDALGGARYGWKIAATSKAGQEHIGVDGPLAGRLFERFRFEDGATLTGIPHMAVVEAEIAFRMASDLDSPDPLSEAEVVAAVDTVCLAIEVPDSRFDRFETAGAAQLLADDACAGRVIVGPDIADWRGLDLREQQTAFVIDGERVAEGVGANVLDGPIDALTWLANDLRGRGDFLAAGQLVMTGTTTVPPTVAPGSQVTAHFAGLGEVRVGFEA